MTYAKIKNCPCYDTLKNIPLNQNNALLTIDQLSRTYLVYLVITNNIYNNCEL